MLAPCFLLMAVLAPQAKDPFEPPVRMRAAGEVIEVEDSGHAAPCLADVDGDGRKDLVVGQFAGGRMKVYRNLGAGRLAEGRWLEVEGLPAEVPGFG